jgi:hypothetical protein
MGEERRMEGFIITLDGGGDEGKGKGKMGRNLKEGRGSKMENVKVRKGDLKGRKEGKKKGGDSN